jgi:hypothetical protein
VRKLLPDVVTVITVTADSQTCRTACVIKRHICNFTAGYESLGLVITGQLNTSYVSAV